MAQSSPQSEPWVLPLAQRRLHLVACLWLECDIDPMILRARLLRRQGCVPQAEAIEQELLPVV
ncbi:hypothetical protein [Cyanobium sp. WAJ14-Wanaka]|uniref:hypothetical protein n=1 Tax=Cyanobium sp. WAJ14-Wanaka TaxID=2823725 RepID=UPI0020CBB20C|nr:hypothetical protein [Cyanobium sp. WAJ14-Wanaka]MCP9775071.1 hypothetical protein [Cyanobium sp. WAJ14-Wanaka]